MRRLVFIDGKVRTNKCYPAGSMDVISIAKTNRNCRWLYGNNGLFTLHHISAEEAKYKLCKVRAAQFGDKGVPHITTFDCAPSGIECLEFSFVPRPLVKADNTVIETGKVVVFKFGIGNVVMVTGGRNRGRIGVIQHREKHEGKF